MRQDTYRVFTTDTTRQLGFGGVRPMCLALLFLALLLCANAGIAQVSFEDDANQIALDVSEGSLSGWLRLEGSGIKEVHLENVGRQSTGGSTTGPSKLHLIYQNDGIYQVPVGVYRVMAASLAESATADFVYHLQRSSAASAAARIVPDSTENLHIGGPLTERLKVYSSSFGGDVSLYYEGCFNEAGFSFSRESLSGKTETLPSWEVRDVSGSLVRSGRFSYG